ncbi:MAG: LapA family protein [Candidatus Lambdaproteobacteria bacterium]|nr:LapA family protein [Candidatus Lambdaproteobacteria bacterium]
MYKKILLFGVLPILVLLLVFAAQNMAEQDLAFLFWTFRLSRVVFLLIFFLAGVLVGMLLTGGWVLGRKRRVRGGSGA